MTIDTSQNVGIGTTSPVGKLTVNGGTRASGVFSNDEIIQSSAADTTNYYNGTRLSIQNTNSTNGTMAGIGFTSSSSNDFAAIWGIASTQGTNPVGQLVFGTTNAAGASAERMRIDSSGNLLLATTSTLGGQFNILQPSATIPIRIRNSSTTSGYSWSIGYVDNSANMFMLNNNSVGVYLSYGGTAWTANSDERLKDIISPITSALESVKSLRAVKYSWKSDADKKPHIGLIAQDVQKVLPEVVASAKLPSSDDETKYLSVAYTEVIPLLVAALQELSAKVDAQAAEITALQAKVGA
jgi:hypothetical protein